MKRILLYISLLGWFAAGAQVYNNEWIDYSKTYYKFKVGVAGLYRISQATLNASGLGTVPAEQFQLWRNGKQVPVYTSVATGPLGGTDYIEFWGVQNDGKSDRELYRVPDNQLNDKFSFSTDTSSYFLTVNPNTAQNLRLTNTINDVAGNALPAEPYFMYTEGNYCKDYLNPGYYYDAGEYVYSSTYDVGESWVCWDIGANASYTASHALYLYSGGPEASIKVNLAGNTRNNARRVVVKINGDSITGGDVNFLSFAKMQAQVPLSTLSSGTANIQITNITKAGWDRMVLAQYELIYPRVFNFGGKKNFEFTLPANAAGNFLQISNFNYGSSPPVLYDLTNGKRYVADISTPGTVKIALQPSITERQLVLVNEEASNLLAAGNLVARQFINFSATNLQGDYLIISNPLIYNSSAGSDPVEAYRAYRASAAGGGFTARIYDVDELDDQFAFGINKHPAGIRNFLSFASRTFAIKPKFVFLIGHGMTYDYQRYYESDPNARLLNLVPTFGYPASDWLLVTHPGEYLPHTAVGRLSVINGDEVTAYLSKVIEYETAQKFTSPVLHDKEWIKNVVHVIGAADPSTSSQLSGYMNNYKNIISDTLTGADVITFNKNSPDAVANFSNEKIKSLFADGISQLTYFGHSSATVLDFNLDNPDQYENQGKYPVFIVMGCNAGNLFSYNPARFYVKSTLSEKFVLAPERGSIAFIASSHFGIAHYLDKYNRQTYNGEATSMYGKSLGEIMIHSINGLYSTTSYFDFFSRMHSEENTLHGDPAIKLNGQPKPDYVIEESMVKVSPDFVSVANESFKVESKFINTGKAVNQPIAVEIKRQYPAGNTEIVFRDTIPGIRYIDSLEIELPIDQNRDKGLNRITVTVDADNQVDEMYESNNSVTRDVYIFEDDIKPVYPYNYSIINKQGIKLTASTANPFSSERQYRIEMDTTEFFNSGEKVSQTLTSSGGIVEYTPSVTYKDSTVYYWRISPLDSAGTPLKWNNASFVYLPNSELGFNQSHFYQHTKSGTERLYLDSSSRVWKYNDELNTVFMRSGIYPVTSDQQADYTITLSNGLVLGPGCAYDQLIINVIDSVSFEPWKNSPGGGLYGSGPNCGSQREYNFHFQLGDTASRRKAMNFLENVVPSGSYVAVRTNTSPSEYQSFYPNTYFSVWQSDTALYGSGKSLYHTLLNQGVTIINDYDTSLGFMAIYKKNSQASFATKQIMQSNEYEPILLSADCYTPDTLGFITSPVLGPARSWKRLKWSGASADMGAGDQPTINVIGITETGAETTLFTGLDMSQQDFDISSVSAAQFPYLKLEMNNLDSVYLTPYQLRYWRVTFDPVPEGAVAPNILYQPVQDTVEVGEPFDFRMAFKNISDAAFDSLKVKFVVTDRNNVATTFVTRLKPVVAGDTVTVHYPIPTQKFPGNNSLYVDVNPDNDQPEQYHINNFIYRSFYAKPDNIDPVLDVTFDGTHILNRDIVSSKPHITVKLKDESKWMILNDTASVKLQVRFPDGTIHPFYFNNADTLKFTEAGQAPNNDNTATIDFLPYFEKDGDYELIVSGKDRSNNSAGTLDYKVGFQVINKPMISNMLNYPNPFTTSTAFVFTITGSEVPQNIKIQILTITGKVVREITKDELGPLHIGRNITEFKWDGTDTYGQRLANGIYLYRVVTNLNGKTLDKYKSEGDRTDKYFNNGYGKMYLMR